MHVLPCLVNQIMSLSSSLAGEEGVFKKLFVIIVMRSEFDDAHRRAAHVASMLKSAAQCTVAERSAVTLHTIAASP
jgi:hypothetical protein